LTFLWREWLEEVDVQAEKLRISLHAAHIFEAGAGEVGLCSYGDGQEAHTENVS
jgi:hypothetical protein